MDTDWCYKMSVAGMMIPFEQCSCLGYFGYPKSTAPASMAARIKPIKPQDLEMGSMLGIELLG
jgi:hypothetical protein